MNRESLDFIYFFNAGIDRITCECDVEGTSVFYNGHFVGEIKWVTPDELEAMDDDELEEIFLEHGILI